MTRLEKVLRLFGLKPTRVLAEAARLAPLLGVRRMTRQYLSRVRKGAKATEDKIVLLVATLRSMTGIAFQAADLFDLEPALLRVSLPALRGGGTLHGSVLWPSICWPQIADSWRRYVEDGEAQQSSSEMLEELYREHAGLLRYTARVRYNIPQSDLDELVNDVFASFLERRPVVADIRGYLLGAIRNAALYYWRKRAHESPLLPEHEEAPDDAEAARMERWTLHLSLGATLARLGTKCRETLMRYYIGEEKPAAIAADMDTTRGYVFQLLHACRKRARELYRNLTEPRR